MKTINVVAAAIAAASVLTLSACGSSDDGIAAAPETTEIITSGAAMAVNAPGNAATDDAEEAALDGDEINSAIGPKSFPAKVAINGRKKIGQDANAPGHKYDAYKAGQMVPIKCQAKHGSEVWDYTTDGWWVPDKYVKTGTDGFAPGVARCAGSGGGGGGGGSAAADPRAKEAIAFARARLGATDWNMQCELFVERSVGTSGKQYSAMTHYEWQKARGRIHTGSVPPPGSVVFFRSNTKWGHVMLSIGDNKAISTGPKVYQDNHFRNRSDYLGWAYMPADW
ncbi:NlpC/P60 family protein [Actinokineospora xionganensis]|uniref:C40 family peptidase n=1 Tax=Actinokineospora xionganensis TaxID=2684470 RepID=A0ABR7LFU7_9PSEU|nr:NlpC/P60 family protein [Actinokineospora xionganensis]MBC6451571.1 C40 family peptidase [Actinokineospora xionganensis]